MNRTTFWATVGLVFSFLTASAFATERYAPASYWLSHGYRPVVYSDGREQPEVPSFKAHSLPWPIQFQDAKHTIGNTMAEFQSYGDGPYYHGGLDLRVKAATVVFAPVAGRIEAGHYGYTNNPDGSSAKYWIPWPKSGGDPTYFEIAVITDDGFRFEHHHLDENKISAPVLAILQGKAPNRIAAGTPLANTIVWPDGIYNHTHFNIITPSGVSLNPEYYAPLLPDQTRPEIQKVIAAMADGRSVDFTGGELNQAPQFFAVATLDHQGQNVYDHPPVYAGITFENGAGFVWDFRERLIGPDGKFPPLWDFFVEAIRGQDGRTYETQGGYGKGVSIVRLPVPTGAAGPFVIQIADQAGNTSELRGQLSH